MASALKVVFTMLMLASHHAAAVRVNMDTESHMETESEAAEEASGSWWYHWYHWPFDGHYTYSQMNANTNAIAKASEAAASNAGHAAKNAGMIGNLGRDAALQSNQIQQNAANIANLAGATSAQTEGIARNAGNIANLGNQVSANTADIATNAQHIASVGQGVSTNAANIAQNAQNLDVVTGMATGNAASIAANAQAIGTVGAVASQNSVAITGLVSSVGMLSGSVAANSAAIGQLTAQVAVLTEAAAPTVALASALGLQAGTVSALSLAGAFTTPILGCVMLVYMCWPDEKNDPWWKMEARVEQMINDRFNQERRKRLTDRLKRYITQFSRCSTAWVMSATAGLANETESLGSHMEVAMHHVSGGELPHPGEKQQAGNSTKSTETKAANQTVARFDPSVPPCMEQLAMHMSLQRDEWMWKEGNALTGLFMPFANLHTQVQALLVDYPSMATDNMRWGEEASRTSAEYAHFMLKHMLDAWKGQVCRTVRLRYEPSPTRLTWYYKLTVLKPVWQPNAGETCRAKCGQKGGWCNFCGGKNVGACCKFGAARMNPPQDPSECLQFDPPVSSYRSKPYHACVHNDCQQQDLYYKGTTLSRLANVTEWEKCQEHCLIFAKSLEHKPERIVFTLDPVGEKECKCRGGDDLHRIQKKGSISGPVPCKTNEMTIQAEVGDVEDETPRVPMEELFPCEYSPGVKNLEELEMQGLNNHSWMYQCYQNVSKRVANEFNPFYKRFAKFVDRLAWKAGCAPHPDFYETEDYAAISESSDFGRFSECNWDKERKRGKDPEWFPDEERGAGLFGDSRISKDEEAKLTLQYPLPAWLDRRRGILKCLESTFKKGDAARRTEMESQLFGATSAGAL